MNAVDWLSSKHHGAKVHTKGPGPLERGRLTVGVNQPKSLVTIKTLALVERARR